MAIVRVQDKSARATGVSSLAVVFDSDVTAGNSIIALAGHPQATMTVADNQSNSYSLDERLASTRTSEIHHASSVAAGATTVTFTPAATDDIDACIIEYDKNLELDQSDSNETSGVTSHPCGSITTTVADETIVTVSRSLSGYAGAPATGYLEVAEEARGYFQERIVTATETTDGAWTSTDVETVTSVICSYNEVVVAGDPAAEMAWAHREDGYEMLSQYPPPVAVAYGGGLG